MFFMGRTRVTFESVFKIDGSLCFKAQNGTWLKVKSLNSGVICVEPLGATNIEEFLKVILGCFDEKSNMYGFRAIEFDFEGVHIVVDSYNMDYESILEEWRTKRKEKGDRRRCRFLDI